VVAVNNIDAETIAPATEAYFWARVDPTGFCWNWVGYINHGGYGLAVIKSKKYRAHRVSYALLVGPVAADLDLDHLCRNRACVNPDHLEAVTRKVNLGRGRGKGSQTHCPQGHEYTDENTYVYDGTRVCKTCKRRRTAERHRLVRGKDKA